MYNLVEMSSSCFDDVQRISPETLASLMKMVSKVKKLLEVRDKFRIPGSGSKTKKRTSTSTDHLDVYLNVDLKE